MSVLVAFLVMFVVFFLFVVVFVVLFYSFIIAYPGDGLAPDTAKSTSQSAVISRGGPTNGHVCFESNYLPEF